MLTALILQLIQCTVVPPKPTQDHQDKEQSNAPQEGAAKEEIERGVGIVYNLWILFDVLYSYYPCPHNYVLLMTIIIASVFLV